MNKLKKEIWKKFRNTVYEVSNLGRIRNTRSGRILRPWINSDGYRNIRLVDNLLKVGRLVNTLFNPNPKCRPETNHINGIKSDDRAVNLEWVTASENVRHAYRLGLMPSRKGKPNIFSKKGLTSMRESKFKKVVYIPSGKVYKSVDAASLSLKVHRCTIHRHLTNRVRSKVFKLAKS